MILTGSLASARDPLLRVLGLGRLPLRHVHVPQLAEHADQHAVAVRRGAAWREMSRRRAEHMEGDVDGTLEGRGRAWQLASVQPLGA